MVTPITPLVELSRKSIIVFISVPTDMVSLIRSNALSRLLPHWYTWRYALAMSSMTVSVKASSFLRTVAFIP